MRLAPISLGPILLAAVLAGCADPATVGDDGAADAGAPYAVPPVPRVDAVALLDDHAAFVTQHNERAANKPTHESARQALLGHFGSYGLETYRHNFTQGIEQANLVGIHWGQVRDRWVVVGAHYDTLTDDCLVNPQEANPCLLRSLSQGAYDNGSGTMMMAHLAKAFANVSTYHTIAFVAFDGEERGTEGAAAFVHDFAIEQSTPYGAIQVVGDLDLDMIGLNWPGVNAPINLLSNSANATALVLAKAKQMGFPDGQVVVKDRLALGSSDYARFWEVSDPAPIPTVFLISDFEEIGAPAPAPPAAHTPMGAYPFWHLQDTVETMTAMAGGHDNLVAGFQSASDLAAHVVHFMAAQPDVVLDAVPMPG